MNYSSWTKQSSTAATNNNNHHHPPPPHNNYRPQQTSIMANTILRFPGLARPSNITGGGNSTGSGGGGGGNNRNKLHGSLSSDSSSLKNDKNNKNNPSYSFEQFNASCDDAWNAKIEDKISFSNAEKATQNSSNNKFNKFGNNQSSIVIKEKQQIPASADHSPIGNVCNGNGETALSSNKKLLDEDSVNHQSTTNVTMVDCGRTNPNETHTKSGDNGGDYNNQHDNKLPNQCGGDPKVVKLKKLLYEDEITDMNQLRTIAWSGIGDEDRPLAWKLLLGYVPAVRSKRSMVFENKKIEYQNLVSQYYFNRPDNDEIYRQIHIDIPRMQPLITIFQQPIVQGIFERILYIWSIRHPASGYVQGMNDLVTPFFVTYLSEFVPGHTFADVESFDVSTLPDDCLAMIEADSYWSFNKLLDSIQDNYTFAQPGIQRLVNLLSKVVSRVDSKLHEHLVNNSVQYLQFAFRWMNNLLIREIPLRCIIRLWDTYLSEGAITSTYVPSTNFNDSIELNSWTMNSSTPFSSAFHLFVCAAFLRFWSKSLLQEQDFQGLMLRLQNLPTFHWSENEVKLLVADAYQLKYFFSPNHLKV